MGSDAKKAFNAVGRDELLWFEPESLTIVENDPKHPLYDPDRLTPPEERLILNIMARGIRVPVIVRLNGKTTDDKPIVEVVDGRQRVRAALEANKRLKKEGGEPLRVPGVRTRGEDSDMMAVMILTNELRKDDTPLAKARKLQRFLALGRTEEEAAVTFGVTTKAIKDWLLLLDCSTEVQKAVEQGVVPSYVARELSSLPREEQGTALGKMIEAGEIKGKKGREAAVRAAKGKTSDEAPGLPTKKQLKRLREALRELEVEDDSTPGKTIAIMLLNFVLDGKKPVGPVLGAGWRASIKEG